MIKFEVKHFHPKTGILISTIEAHAIIDIFQRAEFQRGISPENILSIKIIPEVDEMTDLHPNDNI